MNEITRDGHAKAHDTTIPLTFVRHLTDDDVWVRGIPGGTLFVIPGIWTGMPADIIEAVRARRRASVTGTCPACHSVIELGSGDFGHEPACPTTDEKLRPAYHAWTLKVGRYARGRRITENPQTN